MFILTLPIELPPDRSFFTIPEAPEAPLDGNLTLSCYEHSVGAASRGGGLPLVLRIGGFKSESDAQAYLPTLVHLLRWASIRLGYSIRPSGQTPVTIATNHFDGREPVIFSAELAATPHYATGWHVNGEHVTKLSQAMNDASALNVLAKLTAKAELKLACEIFTGVDFVGSTNAKFIVLLTALEVLIPNNSKSGKRGAVVGLVKRALAGTGDVKAFGKRIDDHYVRRNDLVHAGVAVSDGDFTDLRQLVGQTLTALLT